VKDDNNKPAVVCRDNVEFMNGENSFLEMSSIMINPD
jgi:hypothetical protein